MSKERGFDATVRMLKVVFGEKPTQQAISGGVSMLVFFEAMGWVNSRVTEELARALDRVFRGDDGGDPPLGGGESMGNVIQLFPKDDEDHFMSPDLPYLLVVLGILVTYNVLQPRSCRRQTAH